MGWKWEEKKPFFDPPLSTFLPPRYIPPLHVSDGVSTPPPSPSHTFWGGSSEEEKLYHADSHLTKGVKKGGNRSRLLYQNHPKEPGFLVLDGWWCKEGNLLVHLFSSRSYLANRFFPSLLFRENGKEYLFGETGVCERQFFTF